MEFLATSDMIKMTFRGGDACGLYRNSKEEERGRHLVRRAAVKNGEREEIFLGCLGELLPSLQVQKKKKRCWGYPKDYASNVQMPSRIGQFSSQLTSHGTVAKDQFAKDRHLLN